MNASRAAAAIAVVLLITCAVAITLRNRDFSRLKAEHGNLLTRLATVSAHPTASGTVAPAAVVAHDDSPSSELLRLRGEVTRLRQRSNELRSVEVEHQRLQVQLASRTNQALALPPGYIRRAEARWVGLNTPESTIQSFLWAIQSKNASNVVQVLTPESAAEFLEALQRNPKLFDEDMSGLPGMRPVNQETQPDGSVEVTVEILPGQLMPESLRLKSVNGQWKLAI